MAMPRIITHRLLERQVLLAANEKLAAPSDQGTLPNLPISWVSWPDRLEMMH
jgi:hypothetical protein